jgi:hypothetical protein
LLLLCQAHGIKEKEWLAWNRDNASECSDMSIHSELVLYKNPTKCAGLVHHRHHHHLIEMQFVLVIVWLKSYLLGVKQQSLTHSVTFSEKHTRTE